LAILCRSPTSRRQQRGRKFSLESATILGSASEFQTRYAQIKTSIEKERTLFYKDPNICYEALVADLADDDLTDTAWGDTLTNFAPSVQHMDEREGEGLIEAGKNPNEIPDMYDLAQDIETASIGSRSHVDYIDNVEPDEQYMQSIRELNREQRLFFNHFKFHMKRRPNVQQFTFLSGGAGVGKSVVTRAVLQAAIKWCNSSPGVARGTIKVLVIAPTGTAAFNIDGYTIYSALEIPCNQNLLQYKDLSSEQKNRLETTLGDVRLISTMKSL
jgi:hypothetical protein